jgi:hypothetical protein
MARASEPRRLAATEGDQGGGNVEGGGVRIEGGRNLTWWHFILLVLVYAAIIQISGRASARTWTPTRAWRPPVTSLRLW